MDKKAIVGLDTVKIVILALLTIALIGITGMLVIQEMTKSVDNVGILTGSSVNETITTVDETGTTLAKATLYNAVLTSLTECKNMTSGTLVPSADYSRSGFTITYIKNSTAPSFNGTDWNCTYAYSYDNTYSLSVGQNFSSGNTSFFSQVPTFFVLLGVVILIIIIGIVIVAVSRFAGGSSSELTQV